MATTQTTPQETKNVKIVQKTGFDLTKFADITLKKEVVIPKPVTSLVEAQAAVGNNVEELLKVINAGLEDRALEAARNDMSGFHIVDDEGNLSKEEFTGKFADEDQAKLINGFVLQYAKMQAFGSWDTLSADKKRELKEAAKKFMRETPALLASIPGAPGKQETPTPETDTNAAAPAPETTATT